MILCPGHFEDLKQALTRKGLWYLVDTSPEALTRNIQAWLAGKTTDKQFDPLVGALCEIRQKLVEMGAQQANSTCPLCQVNRILQTVTADQSWIDNVTDMMVLVAKVNDIPTKRVLLSR